MFLNKRLRVFLVALDFPRAIGHQNCFGIGDQSLKKIMPVYKNNVKFQINVTLS